MSLPVRSLALLLGLALAARAQEAPAPRPQPEPERARQLIDEVVAVVDAHSITLSELAAETRVKLVEQQGAQVAESVLDRPLLAASLRRAVQERIVLSEVERLKLFDLDHGEVDQALAKLRARFPSEAAYAQFTRSIELTDDEVSAILARELRVARYLDNRLRLAAQLRDSELDDAAASQRLSKPEREALRARLGKEKYLRLLNELLSELRKRAEVRVLDSLQDLDKAG